MSRLRVDKGDKACKITVDDLAERTLVESLAKSGNVNYLQRRRFLVAAGTLWIAPIAVRAQQASKPYRIGVLGLAPDEILRKELRELGYVEGRDVVLEFRDTGGSPDRADQLALELVRLKVDVIIAAFPTAVLSARRATSTIPIVMVNTPDPVQLGLVASLARPGGNITGLTTLTLEVCLKQLELLKEAVPQASRVALMWNRDNPWHPIAVKSLQTSTGSRGFQLQGLEVHAPDAFEGAFDAMAKERAQAVLVLADPMMFVHRERLADLTIGHRLPMMGYVRANAGAGSLMSYWPDRADLSRRSASYVDRILKGARAGDLPIEQPKKFELIVNLKTAKTLGLTIPQPLLVRADEVIQ